jgi:hypothetical protein
MEAGGSAGALQASGPAIAMQATGERDEEEENGRAPSRPESTAATPARPGCRTRGGLRGRLVGLTPPLSVWLPEQPRHARAHGVGEQRPGREEGRGRARTGPQGPSATPAPGTSASPSAGRVGKFVQSSAEKGGAKGWEEEPRWESEGWVGGGGRATRPQRPPEGPRPPSRPAQAGS